METSRIVKTFTSKKGTEVTFRYPSPTDFDRLWSFACDIGAEDTYVALSAPPTEEEERTFFDGMIQDVTKRESVYLLAFVGDTLIGNGRVTRGKGRHHHVGNMGISLRAPYRNEGIGFALMQSLIDEARALGLRLLTLTCFETNAPALHVYEKLGFRKAGVIPEAIRFKEQYVGEVHLYLPLTEKEK
ncbi:MAG: GNAT family N-acetyltransferase [Patescibacteria group bacterium]